MPASPAPTPPHPPSRHRSLYANDPSMVVLIAEFRLRLLDQVQLIRQHRAAENADAVRRLVHQLKGSGLSYGFPHITAHAGAAEDSLAGGHPLEVADPHLSALIDYIEHIDA